MGVLKNGFFLIFVCSFLHVTSVISTNLPFEKTDFYILDYEFKGLSFSVDRDSASKIKTCFFNEKNGDFHISSDQQISFIQILDQEGNLFFLLPIESKEVHLDIADFDIGSYDINFKFKDYQLLTHAALTKKE